MVELNFNTSIPVHFDLIENIEDSRFLKAKVWICHTGLNLNNSEFDKPVIEDAVQTSLANIPVLGFIEVNSLNEADFRGHEQRLVIEKDGVTIEYVGRAYGTVPETNNAKFENKLCEDGIEREFLTAEVLLWKKFSESVDIFERDGIKGQSMELEPSSIEGSFDKNKVFHFTKFKFEGLCILGEGITPAMRGSVIEKFTTFKIQDSFQEMLSDFNNYYSRFNDALIVNDEHQMQENEQEGGFQVNEKLELFTKFSNLTDEDVAEIKVNIEQYSVEELEVKLSELSEKKINEFTNTAQQLQNEIRVELAKDRYTDSWGDSCRSYWYIDHDDTRIYAEDCQSNYAAVGINYSKNGDFILIDFSTKTRVKFVPANMEGNEPLDTSFVSIERNEFETTSIKEKTAKEIEDKFQLVEQELNEIKPKLETITADFEALKLEKATEVTVSEFTVTQEAFDKLKSENETLLAFKTNKEKEEKMNVFAKFTDLEEEDVKPILDAIDSFSTEEIEDKLFAIKGRKNIAFTSTNKKKENLVFSLLDIKETKPDQPSWVDLVTDFKNKNNN